MSNAKTSVKSKLDNKMTDDNAKQIGAKQGLISVFIGIIIAQLIMTLIFSLDDGFIDALFWITKVDYWYHILIGILIMILCGYYFGQIAGKAILIKNWNYDRVGIFTGMAVLLTTGFLSGITGFIEQGIDRIGTYENPFIDYLLKPFIWIAIIGIIPSIIIGINFGKKIKEKGKIKL